ncbi:MAG TPA: alpha/beta hydrolase-fold protein [Tepidiformaceae bacterium]|nr:alpha/beta hydrolase-fold protein [Tepidiformaceae bacterium]
MDLDDFVALGLHRPLDYARLPRPFAEYDFNRYLDPPADRQYQPCPEAFRPPGIPRGEVTHHTSWADSSVFPSTERDIWIYQSASSTGRATGVALMIFLNGDAYMSATGAVRAPAVLDTLVANRELPPVVALFVEPGRQTTTEHPDKDQRSIEYDTVSGRFAEFLLQDLISFAERHTGITVSQNPRERLVAGMSSGGIAAFTAAWFAPESFGLVLSHCGSFTNVRGGHNYPYLVRTTAPKPIRVFLTSGAMDLDHPVGSWPLANREMAAALAYAGYEHRFEFGEGGHTLRHGGSLFAESLRWLWNAGANG